MRRWLVSSVLCAALALVVLPACGSAREHQFNQARQKPGGGVALKQIGNFDHPTYVTGAPGYPKLLFVVEQPGRVEVIRAGHRLHLPFLDIRDQVGYDGGERGLLSIAFPPDYRGS